MKIINNCLCCLNENKSLLDLGNIPLANDFHDKSVQSNDYPLELMVCPKCYHCQLHFIIDPELLFKNYKYVSGTSQTGLDFFKKNAELINEKNNFKFKSVLDIACNDGSQLDFFKDLGWDTYGVDPATNLHNLSSAKGHKIICDFWNEDIAKQLPPMDVIIAQNVFAHTQHIDNFLQACKIVMKPTSTLYIQTSQKNMIINGEFDTIYHEHISFFNAKSMNILVNRNGLVLNHVSETSIHGISYIFEIKLTKGPNYNINDFINKESLIGICSDKLYNTFSLNTEIMIKLLKEEIKKYKINGYKCVGFGAAAKAQTVLCYGNISLEYIIDENPLKIGLYSPKMNIPIKSFEYFKGDTFSKILIIILAWNFSDEIISKIKSVRSDIIILSYFPKLYIY